MNETTDQPQQAEPTRPQTPDPATWQAPAYEVVDTALEVTAYSLTSR